jgi:hypothetical protein
MTASIVVSFPFHHPRIVEAREGGWYVLRGQHAWLHGDRCSALRDFEELTRIERRG